MKNFNNKISIVVPVYNTEKYLEKCLDSLINQTYKNLEIICVDDGSNDNSLKILNYYSKKDPRIMVFCQSNKGQSVARNFAIKNATGQFLMFCDSDDWYERNMCELMLNCIISKDVDVAVCRTSLDIEVKNNNRESKRYFNNRNYFGKKDLNYKCFIKTNAPLWNKIFKMEIIKNNIIKFPENLHHEDDAFWYMYGFLAKNIYYLKEELYHYVLRENSIVRSRVCESEEHKFDRLKICMYLYNFLKDSAVFQENIAKILEVFCIQLNIMIKCLKKKVEICKALKNMNFLCKEHGYIFYIRRKYFAFGRNWICLKKG